MKDWLECDTCGKEFKVICHAGEDESVVFCPFCGSENDWDDELDEEDDYD